VTHLLHAVATYFGDFKAFFETAGFWSIQGGTRALLDSIMAESRAELRLSTPVRSITDEGSHVAITTDSGERIQARTVVVAVPLNTVGDIAIQPELPMAVREMIQQRNPIKGGKIWIRVKGEIEPFNGVAPVGKAPINAFRTERRYKGDTLIMGICSDASALRHDDLEAVQTALRQFVPDIEVVDTACHDWVTDKFSQGGWMMHRPGNLTNAAPQMRQPHGRIQFAGSDIAIIGPGSIDGAMHSGMLAARNVNAVLASGKY
jgi:monoamine oxidase